MAQTGQRMRMVTSTQHCMRETPANVLSTLKPGPSGLGAVEASTAASAARATLRASTTILHRAAGKRKRNRSQMTSAPAVRERLSIDDVDGVASPKRARPSLSETHSDEDDDAVRFSVPPPPPTEPVPPELQCRYPNKPCPQERAIKKHGELHSYCAYHRFKAQQYQRKLEQKKRERRLREQRSPTAMLEATSLSTGGSGLITQGNEAKTLSPPMHRQGVRARTRSSPPRPSGRRHSESGRPQRSPPRAVEVPVSGLEPFHHPVSLLEGDLQLLQVFLWDSESPPKSNPSGTSRSGAANERNRPDANGAFNVKLDGFTFTSESI